MKKSGMMLSEFEGPLKNLLSNLSGKNGDYWLEALKKFLRKEDLPLPPIEVMKDLNPTLVSAREKMEKLTTYLKSLTVVHDVYDVCGSEEAELLIIGIYPNLRTFIDQQMPLGFGPVIFYVNSKFQVSGFYEKNDDFIDHIFRENISDTQSYPTITDFSEQMEILAKKYQESIPTQ